MTKADQIRDLAAKGKSTHEIAMEVYELPLNTCSKDVDRKAAYVRIVLRQRVTCGLTDTERRYAINRFGSLRAFWRYKNAPHLKGAV